MRFGMCATAAWSPAVGAGAVEVIVMSSSF